MPQVASKPLEGSSPNKNSRRAVAQVLILFAFFQIRRRMILDIDCIANQRPGTGPTHGPRLRHRGALVMLESA